MAVIGLRKPYIGKYLESDGTVSYTGGQILAKAIEFSAKIESTESNNLYADDGIAESDVSFAGGTFEITTDELTQEASALIMGMAAKTITVGADLSVSELVYDDDMNPPDLGLESLSPKKSGGVYSFRAIVFPKGKIQHSRRFRKDTRRNHRMADTDNRRGNHAGRIGQKGLEKRSYG